MSYYCKDPCRTLLCSTARLQACASSSEAFRTRRPASASCRGRRRGKAGWRVRLAPVATILHRAAMPARDADSAATPAGANEREYGRTEVGADELCRGARARGGGARLVSLARMEAVATSTASRAVASNDNVLAVKPLPLALSLAFPLPLAITLATPSVPSSSPPSPSFSPLPTQGQLPSSASHAQNPTGLSSDERSALTSWACARSAPSRDWKMRPATLRRRMSICRGSASDTAANPPRGKDVCTRATGGQAISSASTSAPMRAGCTDTTVRRSTRPRTEST